MRVCERKRPRITVIGIASCTKMETFTKQIPATPKRTSVKQHPAPSYIPIAACLGGRAGGCRSSCTSIWGQRPGPAGGPSRRICFWWEHGLRRDCESDRPVRPCEGPEKMPGCISEDFSNPRLGSGLDCDWHALFKIVWWLLRIFVPNQLRLKSAITTFPPTTRVL